MPSGNAKFATAINCMDGRTQIPVIEWMKKNYAVDYVDMITEPGVDAIMGENKDVHTIEWIKSKVKISIERHNSRIITIVGHHECAGNPVDMQTHFAQIRSAIRTMSSWKFNVQVLGVWVGERWTVDNEFHL